GIGGAVVERRRRVPEVWIACHVGSQLDDVEHDDRARHVGVGAAGAGRSRGAGDSVRVRRAGVVCSGGAGIGVNVGLVGGAGGERMGVAGADAAGAAGAEGAERVEARTGRRLGAVEADGRDTVAVGVIVALVVGRPRVGVSGLAGGGAGKIVRVVDGS